MSIVPKQFYVARRNPAFSREEFREQWRRHGQLAIGLPLWDKISRYTQGDRAAIPYDAAANLPGFDADSDGVATVWFRDIAAMMAIPTDPDHPILLRDEERIFAAMVADVSLFTEEEVLHASGDVAVKIVSFLGPGAGSSADDVVTAAREHARVFASNAGVYGNVTAHRLNVAFDLPGADAMEPGLLAPYAAVTELGFANLEDLLSAVRSPGFDAAEQRLQPSCGARLSLVTSELLLYDEG